MPGTQPHRRKLDYRTFADLKNDLQMLSTTPYDKAGNWALWQVCDHISIFMEKSMDGFDIRLPFPMRIIGVFAKWSTLIFRWVPAGFKAPDPLLPLQNSNDPQAVDRLRNNIARYESFNQPLYPSPLFGKLSRTQWDQIHLIHAAHHFSFLVPQI